jgi:hypothetical protein
MLEKNSKETKQMIENYENLEENFYKSDQSLRNQIDLQDKKNLEQSVQIKALNSNLLDLEETNKQYHV